MYVMVEANEKTFNCVQWLEQYANEVKKIKDVSPFLTVLAISAGIEFLGKLLDDDDLDDSNDCGKKFEDALKAFSSLQKYQNKNLYKLVRCGLAHRTSVKEGIVLDPINDSNLDTRPIVLNPVEFYTDFKSAVDDAQKRTSWPNAAVTQDYVSVISDNVTGSTKTIKITYSK